MAVTIKDVARDINLSISTISKYINGEKVLKANQEKIQEAITRLGFFPNAMARGLRSSQSYAIGLLLPFLKDAYQATNAAKIEYYLQKAGYSVVLCCHRDDVNLANDAIKFLAERKVDGVLLNILPDSRLKLNLLRENNIPVVMYEQTVEPKLFDCVTVDNCNGAYEAVEHLIKQGCKRIATIAGDMANNTAIERLRGYKRVLEDYNLPYDSSLVYYGNYDVASGYAGMSHFWSLTNKPDALFVANYHMCIGTFTAIQHLNIQVPQQLSLITFDDLHFSQIVKPTLTSVRQPLDEMARISCSLLIERIKKEKTGPPCLIRIKPELILRNSTTNLSCRDAL
jgi:DNA-binding LacI/PurR family transcriptional regulator